MFQLYITVNTNAGLLVVRTVENDDELDTKCLLFHRKLISY